MRGGQESVHGAVSGCIVTKPALGSNAERKYAVKSLDFSRLFLCRKPIDKPQFIGYNIIDESYPLAFISVADT